MTSSVASTAKASLQNVFEGGADKETSQRGVNLPTKWIIRGQGGEDVMQLMVQGPDGKIGLQCDMCVEEARGLSNLFAFIAKERQAHYRWPVEYQYSYDAGTDVE